MLWGPAPPPPLAAVVEVEAGVYLHLDGRDSEGRSVREKCTRPYTAVRDSEARAQGHRATQHASMGWRTSGRASTVDTDHGMCTVIGHTNMGVRACVTAVTSVIRKPATSFSSCDATTCESSRSS